MTDWAMTVLADWFSPAPPAASIIELSMEEAEPGLLKFNLTDAGIDFRLDRAVKSSIAVISHRIDELDLGQPVIERQGVDRFLVKVSEVRDTEAVIDLLTLPANLTFQLVDQSMSAQEALESRAPAGSKILYTNDDPPMPYLIEERVFVSGDSIIDARADVDQRTGEPVVVFHFDGEGARRFEKATEENVGRLFAILLDGVVITVPMIREPIRGGSGQISGYFTEQSANYLAVLLRSGALPATLHAIETHFVPTRP
jgi:SecD/SecF fusion protein